MRKLFILFAALFAFAACTQNDVEELSANRADVPETLTVGFEGGDTRIELNEALKTVWTAGDEVSVFYRSDINQRWQYQGETGERVGDLRCVDAGSGTPTKTTKVVIAYPYDEAYYLNSETCDIQAMLPAVQGYKAGSYGEGGNIMVVQSEYNQFSLKSVCGWLRVELTGEGQMVESIMLRGNAGEQVAGELYIDTATAEATLASERGEAGEGAGGSLIFDDTMSMEVTLDCGSGVELSAEATPFYIALPPQTFAEGLTIEVNCAGYKPMTLSTESSITIERNHIVPMEAVEHEAEYKVPANQIWYTATAKVEPYDATAFNVAITSNEWNETTGEYVITFDGELTTIRVNAFKNCDSLTSVTIPDSVTTIGGQAFSDCYSLTSVTIGDSVTTIGGQAFSYCYSLTSVTIPDSVTTIGEYAFGGCSSLTSVTIGDNVTTIGDYAFGGCSNLAEFKGKFAADGGRCLVKDNTIIAYAEASGTTYTIPDSVTTIGRSAFSFCYSLTSVTIPDSVTTIGEYAFENCGSLTSVYCKATTPPTLGGSSVFDTTASGRKIYVPAESVKAYKAAEKWSDYAADIVGYNFETGEVVAISNKLFYTATALVEPNTSAFNVTIASNEWDEVTGEGIITFDDELTTIGVQAFAGCSSLKSVTIPDSVTTIGDQAFSDCYSLTSVTIGDSVTTIGEYAFYICSSLTSVTISDSVTTIGDQAFEGCSSLTSVTIPDSVTTIGYSAFNGCSSLTSVTIGNSVTTIGKVAFASCYSLAEFKGKFAADGGRCLVKDNTLIAYAEASDTTYTIPNSVTTIEEYAFADCRSLTSVTIPDSVTTIGDSAFYLCGSLTSVYCEATTPPTLGGSSVFDANVAARKIYVPAESVEAYKVATNWSDYAADIVGYNFETGEVVAISNKILYTAKAKVEPNKTSAFDVTIASNEWNEATGEGVITFEGELTTIGYQAFYWCDSLTSVTIGDSVTTIGEQAFRNCISLTSVTIPDSVTTIGNNAFDWCYSLTSVTIPDSVTTIGEQAFYGCSSLAEFKGKFAADEGRCLIVDGVLNVFAIGCGVAEYTIPDSVKTIGRSVFESCDSLTSVTIPDSVTTIGHYAFYNCGNLTSVTIPDSVTTIGNYAFQNCSNLTSVYCKATTPPTLGGSYVFDANVAGRKIYVPAASVDDYKSAENWSGYASYIVGYNFETGAVVE